MSKFKYIILVTLLLTGTLIASKVIKIDLSNQRIYAIENGEIVFSGAISSGMKSHRTPRGIFRVIEKDRYHVSNKYPEPNGGAKMPYMLRLTNSGLAIHQGYLPGYPASHGCIRVSKSTAKKLWYWTKYGTKVKIYGDANDFKYVKKKKAKKSKKYAKKKRYKKYAKKKKYYKKRYAKKKRYTKRKSRYKRYKRVAQKDYIRAGGYEIVEVYDTW